MRRERLSRLAAHTLTRVEAYIIVITVFAAVIVAIVGGWPIWIVPVSLVVGIALLGLLVLDSLSDPRVERDAAVSDLDPGQIRDPALRAKLQRALEYVRATQRLAGGDASGILDAADDELPQIEDAARSIFRLSLRIQGYRSDPLILRDLADLRRRKDRGGRMSEEEEAQLSALERLDELVRASDREIDDALAQLGRSYAEMQTISATPEFRGRDAFVLQDLEDSTRRLSDLAANYDEVFRSRDLPQDRRRGG